MHKNNHVHGENGEDQDASKQCELTLLLPHLSPKRKKQLQLQT